MVGAQKRAYLMEAEKEQINELDLARERKVSVDLIKATGKFAVKAMQGQKNPAKGWEPKTNSRERSDHVLSEIANGSHNFGIHLFGDIVDVDIDSDDPFLTASLDLLLPTSGHIWGRKSRPRTHRLYQLKEQGFDPSQFPILKRLLKYDESKVEIRGGNQTRGEYSLLPSSVHPSGEYYRWSEIESAGSGPSITTPESLINGIRLSGAVATLAPYFVEGARNDLTMAISGFLYKLCQISQSIEESMFHLDKDGAENFLRTLMEVSGDDPSDKVARLKTFHQTWRKAELGHNVTGGNTIRELTGDDKILGKLYTFLSDNPDIQKVEDFVSRFAIWKGPGLVVDLEAVSRGNIKPFMTKPAFINSFGNNRITIEGKRKSLPDLLYYMENAIRVTGLTFDPDQGILAEDDYGDIEVNQWAGFHVKPWEEKVKYSDIKPVDDYFREVLCDGDEEAYKWAVGWIADIFKEPSKKPKTAMVLVGLPGAGKSFLGHGLIGKIIGKNHFISTNSVEAVTSDFNVVFDNKILIQCDEAINNRQKAVAAKLKSLISDDTKKIEPKGVDAIIKPSHSRMLFTSNEQRDALAITDGAADRRYTIIKVSDEKCNDLMYWDDLWQWTENHDNLRKLHRWLLDFNYEKRFISRPLQNKARTETISASRSTFDAWLVSMASRGHPLADENHRFWFDAPVDKNIKSLDRAVWPKYVSRVTLTKDYNHFVRQSRDRYAEFLDEQGLGRELRARNLLPESYSVYRPRVTYFDDKQGVQKKAMLYTWPVMSFNELTAYIESKLGIPQQEFSIGEATDELNETPESEQF